MFPLSYGKSEYTLSLVVKYWINPIDLPHRSGYLLCQNCMLCHGLKRSASGSVTSFDATGNIAMQDATAMWVADAIPPFANKSVRAGEFRLWGSRHYVLQKAATRLCCKYHTSEPSPP